MAYAGSAEIAPFQLIPFIVGQSVAVHILHHIHYAGFIGCRDSITHNCEIVTGSPTRHTAVKPCDNISSPRAERHEFPGSEPGFSPTDGGFMRGNVSRHTSYTSRLSDKLPRRRTIFQHRNPVATTCTDAGILFHMDFHPHRLSGRFDINIVHSWL